MHQNNKDLKMTNLSAGENAVVWEYMLVQCSRKVNLIIYIKNLKENIHIHWPSNLTCGNKFLSKNQKCG